MQCGRPGFDSLETWVGKISWRRKWQPTPAFLPGKPHGQGVWQGTVHAVAKSQTQLSNFTYTFNHRDSGIIMVELCVYQVYDDLKY